MANIIYDNETGGFTFVPKYAYDASVIKSSKYISLQTANMLFVRLEDYAEDISLINRVLDGINSTDVVFSLGDKVGINNNNPQFNLDVNSDINFTGNLYRNGNIVNLTSLDFWRRENDNNIYHNSGNVNIGLNSGLYKLNVLGANQGTSQLKQIGNSDTSLLRLSDESTPTNNTIRNAILNISKLNSNNRPFINIGGDQDHFTILGNGNIGLHNPNPQFGLDINGDINLTGSVFVNGILLDLNVNNYVNDVTFNTSNGVLSLARMGLSTLTVDLDGRYLTNFIESDPTVPSYVKSISQNNISAWNNAAINAFNDFSIGIIDDNYIITANRIGGGSIVQTIPIQEGSQFTAGNGINITNSIISHDDTSNLSSQAFNGGIVLDGLGFDEFGHVTSFHTIDLDERYLTSFTETDPTVPPHVKAISLGNLNNWNNAFNHSVISASISGTNTKTLTLGRQFSTDLVVEWEDLNSDNYVSDINFNTNTGTLSLTRTGSLTALNVDLDGRYLQEFTESDPTVPQHVKNITTTNTNNWSTAYTKNIITASVSGSNTKTLTLTHRDGSTTLANWNDYNTDTNNYLNNVSFNNGNLTFIREGLDNIVTNIDGRYLLSNGKAVDSALLNGQNAAYYLNYNNISNAPDLTIYALNSAIGSASGICELNADSKIPIGRLPDGLGTTKVVDNITERNALIISPNTLPEGTLVYVKDASDDPNIESGSATYRYSPNTNPVWTQVEDALTIEVDWDDIENKPDLYTQTQIDGFLANKVNTIGYNKTNWDNAFSWGNHADAGYLTTETDPIWTSEKNNYYTKTQIDTQLSNIPDTYVSGVSLTTGILTFTRTNSQPNLTVSLYNDLDNRYLQSFTESDPTVPNHVKSISNTNISNWNAAYDNTVSNIGVTGNTNKTITLTFRDNSTISANFTDLDNNSFTTGISFDDDTGILTLSRNDSLPNLTTNFDGRYLRNNVNLYDHWNLKVDGTQELEVDDLTNVDFVGGTNVNINYNNNILTFSSEDTIYEQGSGIVINNSNIISHADTSNVINSNNTGGTVVQNVTFDQFGHVLTESNVNLDSRYLQSFTETDPTVPTHVKSISTEDISHWDDSYDGIITAVNVTGNDTKTLTITKNNGTTLSTNWTDNVNTDNYVNGISFDATNGVLTLNRTDVLPDLNVDLDGRYLQSYNEVSTFGDVTARGNVTNHNIAFNTLNNDSNSIPISFRNASSQNRWTINFQNSEEGNNTGNDLYITSYSDAGAYLRNVIQIDRSTGQVKFSINPAMGNDLLATQSWVSNQGFLTSFTETDTLQSVSTRGNVLNNNIFFRNDNDLTQAQVLGFRRTLSNITLDARMFIGGIGGITNPAYTIDVMRDGGTRYGLQLHSDGQFRYYAGSTGHDIWHSGNFPGTLQSITDRGATTTNSITISDGAIYRELRFTRTINSGTKHSIYGLAGGVNPSAFIQYTDSDDSTRNHILYLYDTGLIRSRYNGVDRILWHSGNDGVGSQLDAGLFAGELPSYYLNQANITGALGTGQLVRSSEIPTIPSDIVTLSGTQAISGRKTFTNFEANMEATLSQDRPRFYVTFPSGGWSRGIALQHINNNSQIFDISLLGNGSAITYAHLGFGAFNSQSNLRIYPNGSIRVGDNVIWHAGNDGTGSTLDADLLDGFHANHFVNTTEYKNFGDVTIKPNNLALITTAQFIADLTTRGFFNTKHSVAKTTWSFANNSLINDIGKNNVPLAGCVIETFVEGTNRYTVRLTCPSNGPTANKVFIYNNQGELDTPGWREIYNVTPFSDPSNADAVGGYAENRLAKIDEINTFEENCTFEKNIVVDNGAAISSGRHHVTTNDGRYASTSNESGYIKLRLPVSWTSTRLSFWVDVYVDDSNESFSMFITGNNALNQSWNNTSVIQLVPSSGTTRQVRFGHDGSRCAIYIGSGTDNWSLPQIVIRDVHHGGTDTNVAQWNQPWIISFTATAQNVSSTITNGLPKT